METPLTPKQKELLNSPQAQMIIKALDLQVIPSEAFLRNQKIQARIDEWFQELRASVPLYQAAGPHTGAREMGKSETETGGASF